MNLLLAFLLLQTPAYSFTKVGNGDDGRDLEETSPITSGPILEARESAVSLLERLGTNGIPNLGALIPEVSRTTLFKAVADRPSLSSDEGHADLRGMVYARTIAEPYSATRFFPAADGLNQNQLVALHIHEGLHRSLPPSVRENESIVSQITLAITGPEATHDQVKSVVQKLVPDEISRPIDGLSAHYRFTKAEPGPVSNIGYVYKHFIQGEDTGFFPISSLHVIHSDLYPFGGPDTPFGLGIEGSMISSPTHGMQTGPLGLSARLRVFRVNGFDFGLWAVSALNTLSTEELKQSSFGRDIHTVGISIRKKMRLIYLENFLSYSFGGETEQAIARLVYKYKYGGVVNAKIRAGVNFGKLDVGAYGEIHLCESLTVSGHAFGNQNIGRYRIISAGPEITIGIGDVSLSLLGRFIVNSTEGANFDFMGNLMGVGLAQGSLGGALSYAF